MIDDNKYKTRIIDPEIKRYLDTFGAVCIEGIKWCGKTRTSMLHANSFVPLGDPTGNFQNRQLVQISPATVLAGSQPRLVDEWQEVPPLWDAVRASVDHNPVKGQFLLTGSASPITKVSYIAAQDEIQGLAPRAVIAEISGVEYADAVPLDHKHIGVKSRVVYQQRGNAQVAHRQR